MKEIGILSMQKIKNCGSFMQSYALKKMLEQQGVEKVYFINICPGVQLPGFVPDPPVSFLHKVTNAVIDRDVINKIKRYLFYKFKSNRFCNKYFPMLGLDDICPDHLDMAVIGSDEVFNCCQPSSWGFTTQLYGNIPQAKKVISYAASFGHTTYEQIQNLGIAEEIGKWLKTQTKISVRDDNSFDIVKKLIQQEPQIHLDPALIYDFSKEINQCKELNIKNYILIYAYPNRINEEEMKEIVSFARKNGKRLVSLINYYPWCDNSIIPSSPFKVLKWFQGADYVVTDTFHGTIFSVITKRKFCSLIRHTNIQKMTSLLHTLSLTEQGATNPQEIEKILQQEIHYDLVQSVIEQKRKESYKYLNDAINNQ